MIDAVINLLVNAAYLGGSTVSEVNLQLTQPVSPIELHAIAPVTFRPVAFVWSDGAKCRYSGIAVPYERTWDEVSENTFTHSKVVNPAEPGKISQYAILINKKMCPGAEPEHMLSAATFMGYFRNIGIPDGMHLLALGVDKDPERQPKWFSQVMQVIYDAAPANPTAKEFLEFSLGDKMPKGGEDSPHE